MKCSKCKKENIELDPDLFPYFFNDTGVLEPIPQYGICKKCGHIEWWNTL